MVRHPCSITNTPSHPFRPGAATVIHLSLGNALHAQPCRCGVAVRPPPGTPVRRPRGRKHEPRRALLPAGTPLRGGLDAHAGGHRQCGCAARPRPVGAMALGGRIAAGHCPNGRPGALDPTRLGRGRLVGPARGCRPRSSHPRRLVRVPPRRPLRQHPPGLPRHHLPQPAGPARRLPVRPVRQRRDRARGHRRRSSSSAADPGNRTVRPPAWRERCRGSVCLPARWGLVPGCSRPGVSASPGTPLRSLRSPAGWQRLRPWCCWPVGATRSSGTVSRVRTSIGDGCRSVPNVCNEVRIHDTVPTAARGLMGPCGRWCSGSAGRA